MIRLFIILLLNFLVFCECFGARNDLDSATTACGVPLLSSGLVVRGQNIKRGSYPWMVALMYVENESNSFYFCGGSLISSNHVLTGEWKNIQ